MYRDLLMAMGILAAASVTAVATNQFRSKSLPWIREAVASNPVPPQPASAIAASETTSAPASQPAQDGVTIEAVLAHLRDGTAVFVDAREAHEYLEGHLRGAYNLPSSNLYTNSGTLTGMVSIDQKVIVYCGGGQCEASHNVRDALIRDFGYTDVSIYTKGWEEVTASGKFADWIVKGDQP